MNNPVLKRNVYRKEELKGQLQLTYNKTFGLHGIDAVASVESFKKDNPYFDIHAVPASNSLHLFDFQTMDTFNDHGNMTEARLGYIGRIHYNYAQKYLLEVSARYDGACSLLSLPEGEYRKKGSGNVVYCHQFSMT